MLARIFLTTKQQLHLSKSFKVDICQSEKDGDLQSKLQAIKTAEEEDFGHSQIGQVYDQSISPDINMKHIPLDEVMAVEDSGVSSHQ